MLMLRKNTQPLLDAIGLEDLHTEIKSNVLVLVGTCGKLLVSIDGISFNGKPTAAEREYATELFKQFLEKHATDLKAFVAASKEFSSIEPPVLPSGMRKGTHGAYNVCHITTSIGTSMNNWQTTLTIGAGFVIFNHAFIPEMFQEVIDTYQAPALAYLEALEQYQELQKSLDKERAKIQTCSI